MGVGFWDQHGQDVDRVLFLGPYLGKALAVLK